MSEMNEMGFEMIGYKHQVTMWYYNTFHYASEMAKKASKMWSNEPTWVDGNKEP